MTDRRLPVLFLLLALVGSSCDSNDSPKPTSSRHYEELGVSFDFPGTWEILQATPSSLGPTLLFNTEGADRTSANLVLAMFIELGEGETGRNDKLLQGVVAGHEALLDQALLESVTRGGGEGSVSAKETMELESTGTAGGYVIQQTCQATAETGETLSVTRRFEVANSAPNRAVLTSHQATEECWPALESGLGKIRETLQFAHP